MSIFDNTNNIMRQVGSNIRVNQNAVDQYITEAELVEALENYPTNTELNTTLEDYVTDTQLETKLNSYLGKTVVHMGDSWVDLYNIAELAAEKIGYNVINCGIQGTSYSDYKSAGGQNNKYFAAVSLARAIRDNDWTQQDATGLYSQKIATLKAVDWSNVDVLILSYGLNDFNAQNPLGDTSARDEESVCGALKLTVQIFQAINPNMEIIITTPCYRSISGDDATITSLFNGYMNSQEDYRLAILSEATTMSVKVVDMYAVSGFNNANASATYVDNLHPTQLGQQMWVDAFAKYIEKGYCGLVDTSVNYAISADNLSFDSEQFTRHQKWNMTYTVDNIKYLCIKGRQQFREGIVGIKYYNSLPIGTVIKVTGYGRKIGDTNHRLGFYVVDSNGDKVLDKFSSTINNTSDSLIQTQFTTTDEYSNVNVVFYFKNMTRWDDGKALVRNLNCTVTQPQS